MFSYAYDFTPDVEVGSIDEGYFDLTGVRQPAVSVAETVRRAIRQALKLSVSEGVAANKLISQIASKLNKPAAFEVVPAGTEAEFLQATLRRMADKLMAKVREDGKSIRTVTVKVRYNDMDEQQASESLKEPTDLETEIYSTTSILLRKAWQRRVSLRLVSLKL